MNAEKIREIAKPYISDADYIDGTPNKSIPYESLPSFVQAIETALQQEAKALTTVQIADLFQNCPVNSQALEAEEYDFAAGFEAIHAALPPESERIRELEDKYTELAQFDNLRLQKLQAERNAFESKIAMAIEILKKPYKFDQGALIKLFRDIAEAIQILESKNE